jgi:transposase
MQRYIGVDAHLRSCTFAVMGPTGRRLREQVVETNGQALRRFLGSIAGDKHICLEEGELSGWLHELLAPLAKEVLVIQPEKRRGSKSDALDAWDLAEQLRKGGLRGVVYKAPGRFAGLREAVHAQRIVTRDMVRAKNRLRAVYRARGVTVEGHQLYDPKRRAAWLKQLPEHPRHLAELFSEHLDGVSAAAQRAEAWLLEEARRYPIVGLIATAPGIGDVRASQIVATVITPHRFRTKRQFWSYCGLAVVTRSSSDWEPNKGGGWVRRHMALPRGLNRNRHPLLKEVFKGAALSVITLMRDHPLARNYQRLIEAGTKPNLARLTIARQLAAAVLAMWKNLEAYDPARHEVPITA